ncbi:MAG: PAS domain S-box protein [Thermodesulfobacteriota bacterium]
MTTERPPKEYTPRILLVEDDAAVTRDLARTLEAIGYELAGIAHSAEEVLPIAEESLPDLILMDIRLPGKMDGIEAAEQLRSRFDFPVVYLTAFTDADLLERAKKTNPYGYLGKPVSARDLRSTIEMALCRHKADERLGKSEKALQQVVRELQEKQAQLELQESELRSAQISLKESSDRYTDLYDSAPIAYLTLGDQGIIEEANLTSARMFGVEREFLLGNPLSGFVLPDDAHIYQSHLRQVSETRSRQACEIRLYRQDGTDFHAQLESVPARGARGESAACQTVILDITERKRAEEALRRSEAQKQAILDGITTNIAFVNEDLEIVWVNKTAADSVNKLPSQMVGKTCHQFWAGSDTPCEGCPTVKAFTTKKSEHTIVVTPDGRVWDEKGEPVFDAEGKLMGVVEIAQDVTDWKRTEDALRKSNSRLDHAQRIAHIGNWEWNRLTREIYWSDEIYRIFGLEPGSEAPSYRFARDFLHPEDRELWEKALAEAMESHDFFGLDCRAVRRDGTVVWIHYGAEVVRDESGQPVGLIGTAQDISERKQIEEQLKESERRYRDLYERAPIGIFQTTIDGRVLSVNPACAAMFSYPPPDEMVPGIRDVGARLYADSERRQALIDLAIEADGFVKAESEYVRKDGSRFWGQLYFRVVRDRAGKVSHLEGFMEDITARRMAGLALQASEQKYRQLFENAPVGIVSVDTEGRIIEVNRLLLDILGSPSVADTKAINVFELPQLIRSGISDAIRSCMDSGERMLKEVPYTSKWGKQSHMRVLLTPIQGHEGQPAGCQAVVEDFTQQKLLEEQLREAHKMEAIGTLAGGIAHDFNNLLHIIAGHAELLQIDLAEQDMRFSELDAIQQSALRGADLVKQILTFSRRVHTKFELTDLNEEVENTHRLLSRTIPKMIAIELRLEGGLAPIRADSTQIEQMLINLAVNAKDAMPEGGTLTIETHNVDLTEDDCRNHGELAPGSYVLLKVSDTGNGIEEGVIPHIFEPFFTTKGLADGTGLGLATVFGIVKMHHGHITFTSAVGQGTSFDIYFPAAEPAMRGTDEDLRACPLARGGETILVVDDEPLISELAKRILERGGYSVISAVGGHEALEIYKTEEANISMVVLDLIMPGMGGKQCLEELLKINPRVKALIASGFAVDGETRTFLDSKAKGNVAKPFHVGELLRAVRRVLDRP